MSDTVGRVIGKRTDGRIIVRLDHRVMAEFGELWIIDDEVQESLYFIRVVDTTYGRDISSDDNIDIYAKTLLDNPDLKIYDEDRESLNYNYAITDILGIISEDRIVDYYRIPSILAKVRRPNDREYRILVS
jgi:hypothetical protein